MVIKSLWVHELSYGQFPTYNFSLGIISSQFLLYIHDSVIDFSSPPIISSLSTSFFVTSKPLSQKQSQDDDIGNKIMVSIYWGPAVLVRDPSNQSDQNATKTS